MKKRHARKLCFLRSKAIAFLAAVSPALWSVGADAQTSTEEDEIYELSPFEVRSEDDFGYRKTNAITATKLGAPIIETPLNISVVPKELLEDLGVRNTNQMFYYTAGVQTDFDAPSSLVAGGGGDGGVRVRGFGTSFVYQDGFRRGRGFHIDGLDRTEVVKGPVGIYFGRTDPGGIINFISKKPYFIDQTEVAFTVGNDSLYKGLIDDQGILVEDKLAYRFVASYRDSDDWMQNVSWEESYFLGSLKWRPAEKWDIDFQYQYFNQNRLGGRVSAMVANLVYLEEAKAGRLVGQAEGRPETGDDFTRRYFADNGVNLRRWNTGFWEPREFNFNRNKGAFDDNLAKDVAFDVEWRASDDLDLRFGYASVDSQEDVSWYIAQDAFNRDTTRQPYILLETGGEPCFTCLGLGAFQSSSFDPRGGSAPGRNNIASKTHNFQFDASYSFDALGGQHTLVGSLEAIYADSQTGGFFTDISAFVKAGGTPFGVEGFGADTDIVDEEANQLLMERRQKMASLGIIGEDDPLPPAGFGDLWVNVGNPDREIPDMGSWISGRSPWRDGEETIDRSAAIAYRGKYLEGDLTVMAGVRFHELRQTETENVEGEAMRGDWSTFDDWLPTIGLSYFFTPEMTAYASYSETFLPQGAQINPTYTNTTTGEVFGGNILSPQTGSGYDVGLKTNLGNGVWSGTLSYFQITRGDLIIAYNSVNRRILDEIQDALDAGKAPSDDDWEWFDQDGNPLGFDQNRPSLSLNGGEQETRGIEMDMIWTPNKNFQGIFSFIHFFDAHWTVKDPEVVNVNRGGNFVGYIGLNDGTDAIPDKLENVSENAVSLWGKYTFTEGALKNFTFGLGGNWQDEEIHEARTNGFFVPFTSGDWWRFDAMAKYSFELWENPIDLHLAVNNVLDNEIVTGSFGKAPTKEWSLTARYKF